MGGTESKLTMVERVEAPLTEFLEMDEKIPLKNGIMTHIGKYPSRTEFNIRDLASCKGVIDGKTFYCRHYDITDEKGNYQCRYVCSWNNDVYMFRDGQLNFSKLEDAVNNLIQ